MFWETFSHFHGTRLLDLAQMWSRLAQGITRRAEREPSSSLRPASNASTPARPRRKYTTLRMKPSSSLFCRCSSLSTLDPGSGREILATCHGTGVWHGIFYPRILELGMGRIQAVVSFLAWSSTPLPPILSAHEDFPTVMCFCAHHTKRT